MLVLALLVGTGPLSLQAQQAPSRVYRVDADAASATPDGSTWERAFATLQDALLRAQAGDEIWVAAGTYRPTTGADRTSSFALINGVRLLGGFAGGETSREQRDWRTNVSVLSGEIGVPGSQADNTYHVVTSTDTGPTTVIDGFTIHGGSAIRDYNGFPNNAGGGLLNRRSTATVTNIRFEANSATYGGGMYSVDSPLAASNLVFVNNAANEGGGMYSLRSDMFLRNGMFLGNTANIGGGMLNSSSAPRLANIVLSGNRAAYGGAVYNTSSSPTFVNATFSGNSASAAGGGGAVNSWDGRPVVQNSVLWGNTDDTNAQIVSLSGAVTSLQFSLVAGGYPGAGNLQANPLFRDADGADNTAGTPDDDLRLRNTSPAVDAGNNALVPSDVAGDLNGTSRFVDMPFARDSGAGDGAIVDMGAYETAYTPVYVRATAGGEQDGRSWSTAYALLTDGLAAAGRGQGDVVFVARGTYTPGPVRSASFDLPDGIAVYGGFAGTETALEQRDVQVNRTVLSGDIGVVDDASDNSYHVVSSDGVRAILDGFVITGGRANGASFPNNSGGGVFVQGGSLELSRVTITGNVATRGAGLYTSGAGLLINSVVIGNIAAEGGGIFSDSGAAQIVNTTHYPCSFNH